MSPSIIPQHTKKFNGLTSGKGGCDLPSDRLSREEREKRNGQCVTVKLRPGMKWKEFDSLSKTMQQAYLEAMIQHGAYPSDLAKMLGVAQNIVRYRLKVYGLEHGAGRPNAEARAHAALTWDAWCRQCKQEEDEKRKELDTTVNETVNETVNDTIQEEVTPKVTPPVTTWSEITTLTEPKVNMIGKIHLEGKPADILGEILKFRSMGSWWEVDLVIDENGEKND